MKLHNSQVSHRNSENHHLTHDVSETGFCLRLQTEHDGDRIEFLKCRVFKRAGRRLMSRIDTTRKKKVVGLERGPLSLVSTTEELLDRKVAAPV
jgi:hypothetical protein